MKGPLDNFTAVVTGAAAGIGRQLSLDLLREEGCHLILIDRDREGLEGLAKDIQIEGKTIDAAHARTTEIFPCDVSNGEQVDKVIQTIGPRPIDLLVNNAGIAFNGTFESSTISDFEKLMNVNLLGAVRLIQGLLPNLLLSKSPSIVNVASLAGLVAAPGMCPYTTSKFALVGFSEALSAELHGRVNVSTICPAFVKTDIAKNSLMAGEANTGDRSDSIFEMDRILKKVGSSPMQVSRTIIRAVKKKEKLVVVNPEAKAIFYLTKFFPGISETMVGKAYDKLLKTGVIRS